MANKKAFINPLTRSSEESLHLPHSPQDTSTSTQTLPPVSPPPSAFHSLRKRGNNAFEKTHQRFTGWMDKQLKQQFETLAQEKSVSKTSLLNEAIADLLRKYMQQ